MPAIALLRGPCSAGAAAATPRASTSRAAAAPSPAAAVPRRRSVRVVAAAGGYLGEDAAFADVPHLTSGGAARRARGPQERPRRVYRSFEDEENADAVDGAPSSSTLLGPDGLPYDVPKSAYGLTLRQMGALGLASEGGPGIRGRGIDPASLSAHAAYAAATTTKASASTSMMAGRIAPASGQSGSRRKSPPDLPSLLLDGRIVYIGMALVPQVTELVISELLWLNYTQPTKPVSLYIHSTGSQTVHGEQVAFENEAYAVIDTMRYIKPDIFTIVVGQAMGTAALLVASGKKGGRYALPNARIQVGPPRINRAFGRTANMMIKANELEKMTDVYSEMLAGATGFPKKFTRRLIGRNRWLTPADAIEARVIDKIYEVGAEQAALERKHFEAARSTREAAAAAAALDMAAQAEMLEASRENENTDEGGGL